MQLSIYINTRILPCESLQPQSLLLEAISQYVFLRGVVIASWVLKRLTREDARYCK